MAGMTVDGLVSGLDVTGLVNQLLTVEGAQQKSLQARLTATEKSAAAYRAINTKFDALRTLAAALTRSETWNPTKATSSPPSVGITAAPSAQPAELTFSVVTTAASHTVVSDGTRSWSGTDQPYGLTIPIEVFDETGIKVGEIPVVGTDGAAPTLADAVKAISGSSYGLAASAVQVTAGSYRLQVTARDSGAAGQFRIGATDEYATVTQGRDAHLRVGTTAPYDVRSATNTFEGLLPGVTLTVAQPEPQVTVKVARDPEAVAGKAQELVDAANAVLTEIKRYGDPKGGTAAVLKGDNSLARLAGDVLAAVSAAVGTDGSPGTAGVELTRDGKITFAKDRFLAALAADPARVQRLVAGTPERDTNGDVTDGYEVAAVPGLAGRLEALAKKATDKTTGSLVLLAKGRDDLADDLKDRIGAWDLRLENRREALTRQFSALEVALSKMRQQSSWLAGQLASLPTTSA